MARALVAQAERIADAVRHNLSDPPGSGEHDQPWRQTGALRDSIGASPKREAFAAEREEIARAIGAKVAAALRGEIDDELPPTQSAFAGAIPSGSHTIPRFAAPARTAFRPQRGIILAGDIASDLEGLGGGVPHLVPTKKEATQFIFSSFRTG